MENLIIRQVRQNKNNKQLSVTIPRSSGIELDDYVVINKLDVKVEEI
jgi:hypothetical protein